MKRRTMLRLIVSLMLIAAFVMGATIIESNNSSEPMAWLSAQQHREVLWVVDAFALLTLLPVFGFASAQNRLAHKAEEISEGRVEHQKQLEKTLYNAGHMDRLNAEQTEELVVLEQTVADLKAQLANLQAEVGPRQPMPEQEPRSFAEQAFAALSGQVEANNRQMEAVNLAMQYQRAEMKNLRQGLRAIQRPHDIFDIARLTPSELTALEAEEPLRMLGHGDPNVQTANHFKDNAELEENEELEVIRQGEALEENRELEETVFFAPTMNAQSTLISPMAAFSFTSELTDDMNSKYPGSEENIVEANIVEENIVEDTAREESTSENKIEEINTEEINTEENKLESKPQQGNIRTAAEKAEKKLERGWRLRL